MDDEPFTDYEHKLPLQKMTSVTVDGDLSLYNVKVDRVSSLLVVRCTYTCMLRPMIGHPGADAGGSDLPFWGLQISNKRRNTSLFLCADAFPYTTTEPHTHFGNPGSAPDNLLCIPCVFHFPFQQNVIIAKAIMFYC